MKLAFHMLMIATSIVMPSCLTAAGTDVESPEQRDARMAWWREARFGIMFHWGVYSVPAGVWRDAQIPDIGEWIMHKAKIPVAEYAAFAEDFNPVKFDADAWVRAAKEAGAKYVILTAKHHDGFAMFHSKASKFNIVDASPFKRDPLGELAVACARHGMRLGVYYSHAQDWHHPGGSVLRGRWDDAQRGDLDDYLRNVARPQVGELLTRYGRISVVYWDVSVDMTPGRAVPFIKLLTSQPGIITNNRLGGGARGDYETPENRVPAKGYPRDWETAMTMNDTWGFKSWDDNWKSDTRLIRTLVDVASKGGNFLLNTGPTAQGEILAPAAERLRAVGAWMAKYGESVYGTLAGPFLRLEWGCATRKADKLYLHVYTWPADGRLVVPMRGKVKSVRLLGVSDGALGVGYSDAGLTLELPAQAPEPSVSVIVLEGAHEVDPLPPPPIKADAQGVITLNCDEADLAGPGIRVDGHLNFNLVDWRDTSASASWKMQAAKTGEYEVSWQVWITQQNAGSQYIVAIGEQQLSGVTTATDGDPFVEQKLGVVRLDASVPVEVSVRAREIVGDEFNRLGWIKLRPRSSM